MNSVSRSICISDRHLLLKKPTKDVHEAVGSFFKRPRGELIIDLLEYFTETGDSGCLVENLRNELPKKTSLSSDSKPESSSSTSVTSESLTQLL